MGNPVSFSELCGFVLKRIENEWKNTDELQKLEKLENEKRAILGYEENIREYKEKIRRIIEEDNLADVKCPPWYRSLKDGVFNEIYGLSGLSPWAYDETEEYARSSSAKLIGDRLYCLIDGVSRLQPQRISKERRDQLKRAFLMAAPRERLEAGFHEVYLKNGIRITIFSGDRTKPGRDVMVFRKYVMKELTFEELYNLGTIPKEGIELFKLMVKIGFNVIFTGPVRSGKTTFLQVWQRYEDPYLEGATVATDPETEWDEIMPGSPIMQLVADGRELEGIVKPLLRGDNDYIILEEARDAEAFQVMLEVASLGTGRCKATVHTRSARDLPEKIATKIRSKYGGDDEEIIRKVAGTFDYVFEFRQDEKNKAKKILTSLSEYSINRETGRPRITEILKYNPGSQSWTWHYHLSDDKRRAASGFTAELEMMENILKEAEAKGL